MVQQQQVLAGITALLSSSCCVIQLVLNVFSVSCAGFAVFTPYRSLLTAFTILLLTHNAYKKGLNNRGVLFSVIISVCLMISPNIVQMINHGDGATTSVAASQFYRVELQGLGCEACANRIRNTLNAVDWIHSTKVFFDNQTAIVQTLFVKGKGENIIELIRAIDKKYDAQVLDSWVGDYTK
ncbi:unnamed protein product [Mucor hiemalis]